MPFKSPRFAGNAVLEEILADPDTGTKKLAKHSPEDAVRLAQKALIDLHWVEPYRRADGTILVPQQFVDGDYGPWTTATVLAYKKRYGICYPPGDPNGTYDGYTGPRTLQRLHEVRRGRGPADEHSIECAQQADLSGLDESVQLGRDE